MFIENYEEAIARGEKAVQLNPKNLIGHVALCSIYSSAGRMEEARMQAAEILESKGISAEVIHMGSIKPIDRDLITQSISKTGCAVTAENATILGGFGSAVAEVLGEEYPAPLQRIGVRDRWVDSGGIDELFTHHGMLPTDIAAAAQKAIQAKGK